MQLHVYSNASFLNVPKAHSCLAGHFFLSNQLDRTKQTKHDSALHVNVGIIKNVVSSVFEAELAAAFANARQAVQIRTTLQGMGHKQQKTPVQLDNEVAESIIKDSCKQKQSRAINMNYYWLQDCAQHEQFYFYWAPGPGNLADYHSKKHSTKHHQNVRPVYLHTPNSPSFVPTTFSSSALRGCVKPLAKPQQEPRLGLGSRQVGFDYVRAH